MKASWDISLWSLLFWSYLISIFLPYFSQFHSDLYLTKINIIVRIHKISKAVSFFTHQKYINSESNIVARAPSTQTYPSCWGSKPHLHDKRKQIPSVHLLQADAQQMCIYRTRPNGVRLCTPPRLEYPAKRVNCYGLSITKMEYLLPTPCSKIQHLDKA